MKERLITFTRSNKNGKILRSISFTILLIWLLIFFILNILQEQNVIVITNTIKVVFCILWIIQCIFYQFIEVLFKENDTIIRKNRLVIIFLSNYKAIETINTIIFLACILALRIKSNLFFTLCIVIAFLTINSIVSTKISEYFKSKLKK